MGNSIPKTMRAIVVRKAGGPEVLSLEQRPVSPCSWTAPTCRGGRRFACSL